MPVVASCRFSLLRLRVKAHLGHLCTLSQRMGSFLCLTPNGHLLSNQTQGKTCSRPRHLFPISFYSSLGSDSSPARQFIAIDRGMWNTVFG
jgi:hypothetical protein